MNIYKLYKLYLPINKIKLLPRYQFWSYVKIINSILHNNIILYKYFSYLNTNIHKLRSRGKCREYQNSLEGCKTTIKQILKSHQKEVEHTLKQKKQPWRYIDRTNHSKTHNKRTQCKPNYKHIYNQKITC